MPHEETNAINRLYGEVHGIRNDLKNFVTTAESDIRGLMINSERIAARAETAASEASAVRRRLYGDDGSTGEMAVVTARLVDLEHERWKRQGVGLLLHTLTTAVGVLAAIAAAYAGLKQAGIIVE